MSDLAHKLCSILDDYQEQAHNTADYPATVVEGNKLWITYPLLGLMEELAELEEALEKYPDFPAEQAEVVVAEATQRIKAEAGDAWWYVSEICTVAGWSLSLLVCDAQYRHNDEPLHIRMGHLAGRLKKVIRNNKGVPEDAFYRQLWEGLVGVVVHLIHAVETKNHPVLSRSLFLTTALKDQLSEVLVYNLQKLASRKERGVIKSEGDNR